MGSAGIRKQLSPAPENVPECLLVLSEGLFLSSSQSSKTLSELVPWPLSSGLTLIGR